MYQVASKKKKKRPGLVLDTEARCYSGPEVNWINYGTVLVNC